MLRTSLIAGFLAATVAASAQAREAQSASSEPILVSGEGLSMKLSPAGFDLLGQIAKDELINRMQNQALPAMEMTIPLIARARLEDLSFSVKLKKLAVSPAPDSLDVDTIIDNIELRVGHIRFENYLVPFLGTSCYATKLDIGNHQSLPLSVNVGASLGDPDFPLELRLQDMRFDLRRGQYRATGPSNCRGPFDIQDYFTRFVVAKLLDYARPAIEKKIRVAIVQMIPTLESTLNQLTNILVPVETPDIAVLPATVVNIGFKPYELEITNEHLAVKLSMRLQKAENALIRLPQTGTSDAARTVFGTFGASPVFLNQFLQLTMGGGTNPLELLPEMHQFIDVQTQRQELATFFPDLAATRVDNERLRLFLRFNSAPSLETDVDDTGTGVLAATFENVELAYKIQQGDEWVDYAVLTVTGRVAFAPSIEDGQFKVKVQPDAEITVKGRWADGYTPVDPTIDEETATGTYSALLFLLARRTAPPVEFPVPVLPIVGRQMTVEGLRIDESFVTFDLVGIPAR